MTYAKSCQQQSQESPLKDPDMKKLEEFVATGEALKNGLPNIKFGEKRKHALVGQQIFQKFVLVQCGCVNALIDPSLAQPNVLDNWKSLDSLFVDELGELLKKDLEFNDLEDEDNDEEIDLEECDPRFVNFEYYD